MDPSLAFGLAWGTWFLSWAIAAIWSSRTVARPSRKGALMWQTIVVIGVVLLVFKGPGAFLAVRLWHTGYWGAMVLAAATVPCFLFTWWARIHLGKLWSGSITRKENHRIVDTGPYAIVRHPIYTGLIGAVFASAAAKATLAAVFGAVLITAGLWAKARFEEAFLMEELGAEAYAAYRRRVPMLVPFWPRRD